MLDRKHSYHFDKLIKIYFSLKNCVIVLKYNICHYAHKYAKNLKKKLDKYQNNL